MHLIGTILIGLITGIVAKLLMPGRDPGGWIISIILGLSGSFIAGFLGRFFGWYDEDESAGFICSVLGAMLLLYIYRRIVRDKSPHPVPVRR